MERSFGRPPLGALLRIPLALLMAVAPHAALAYPATWEFTGTVTGVHTENGGSWPSDITVGIPIRVLVSFDTDELLAKQNSAPDSNNNPRSGARYVAGNRYGVAPPSSLQIALYAGTTCAPCVPTNDAAAVQKNEILVRDGYQHELRNAVTNPDDDSVILDGTGAYDGYTFGTTTPDGYLFQLTFRDLAGAFSPEIVNFTGGAISTPAGPRYAPLPVLPDPRLPSQAGHFFQVCNQTTGDCINARLDHVAVPTYGVAFIFTGRHCQYPDQGTVADDCIESGVSPRNQAVARNQGGSAGWTDFQFTYHPVWPNPLDGAQLDDLGTVFGAVAFGGPGGLPVLRGSAFPSDVSRANSNLLAYQKYTFAGAAPTELALAVNLDYSLLNNAVNADPSIQTGLKAGGAGVFTTLSVIDGAAVPPEAMAAVKNFNSLECGAESQYELANGAQWPAGSIIGMAQYGSADTETGSQSRLLKIVKCVNGAADPAGNPVVVSPGQQFYLAASLQTPARGRWSQAGNPAPASNGVSDASHTLRVVLDPAAPPAVRLQLAEGLETSCTTCKAPPVVVIDIKPGSVDNAINASSAGVIPVAILGTDSMNVSAVNRSSLQLGILGVRSLKNGAPQCSVQDINADGLPDLVCQFQNEARNWAAGQTVATLTGQLTDGEPIAASDSIRLVP